MREVLALTCKEKYRLKAVLNHEGGACGRSTLGSTYQQNHVTLKKIILVRLSNAFFEPHPITVVLILTKGLNPRTLFNPYDTRKRPSSYGL